MTRLLALLALSALAGAAQIRFREVAAERDLAFTLHNSPSPQKHLIETMTGGVAAFDADGDGFTDIFFVNGAAVPSLQKTGPRFHNRLFRNVGGKRFEDITAQANLAGAGYSMGAAAADFDNDGDQDLFVPGVGLNKLYRNNGKGVFADITAQAGIRNETWSVAAAWLDFDNDGLLDLWVVNYLDWSPKFDTFCGDERANVRSYCHPKLFQGLPDTLYRNRGDGTFEDVSQRAGLRSKPNKGMSAAVADFDLDGFSDVFVTNDKEPSFLWRNRGDGTFEEIGLLAGGALPDSGSPASAMGVDFRDYDRDGRPDIVYTALRGERTLLFRNAGDALFEDAAYSSGLGKLSVDASGWSVGLFDFDNDGYKDLFTANAHVNDTVAHFEPTAYRLHNRVYRGAPNGKFLAASGSGLDQAPPRAHRGAAFADFNHDGRIDVVVSALGEPAELWENTSEAGNWLDIETNTLGVKVQADGQSDHTTQAVGYASSSNLLHFGLGPASTVKQLEITWPSGKTQTLNDIPANQRLRLTPP